MFKLGSIEHDYKDPKVSLLQTNALLAQKGYCFTWNQRLIRGPGSIPTEGNKFYNPYLHNIARSDRIGFKAKNPTVWGPDPITFCVRGRRVTDLVAVDVCL